MDHSAIQITYDRYGHLMSGAEAQVAGLLDAGLASSACTTGSPRITEGRNLQR
jgi:hypothetical protein